MMSTEENVGVLIEAWKLMVGRLPGATIEHAGGVATMFGNVPLPFFNLSIPDRPLRDAEDLRAVLMVGRERAEASQHGSLFGLCEAWAPDKWEQVAGEERLAPEMYITGMATDQLLSPRRPFPPLEFRRVLDEPAARDLAMINQLAYGMPPKMIECICNLHLWHEDSFGYVGYAGGRAVSSAACLPVAGTLYVALVATVPEAQGRGYAEAVMRHAIEEGRPAMGVTRMTLHASDMGRPLYRAMGFAPGARVALLASKEKSATH